jgi:hypothetical protein
MLNWLHILNLICIHTTYSLINMYSYTMCGKVVDNTFTDAWLIHIWMEDRI